MHIPGVKFKSLDISNSHVLNISGILEELSYATRMPGAGAALTAGMCLVYARALPVYLGYIDCQKPDVSLAYILVYNSTNSFVTKKLVYAWHTSPRTALCHCKWVFFADGTMSGICVVYGVYHAYTREKIQMTDDDRTGIGLVY